ncbi:hypothetical protein HHL19_36380 [Streptomyces sp. R302]|uniref:hypothetical protein n=1 Tax=unclassified Streptomyces TaxID=2593676 RepID=UPI00145C75EA|nr:MULTISPECIES: hypothetical protein [unclassified Streptomyces]NML55669.1 hypothetical protein [Streptomyces sp. R301]NML83989.1 hypothetical protein [Streptomyces sp. R302]
MRVEMLRLMANPKYGNAPAGAIVDMDPADAARRIAAGDCKPVDEPPKKRRPAAPAPASAPPGDGPEAAVEDMTVEQLKAYAAAEDIDLGAATRKDEIRAAVVAALEQRRDEDGD